MPDFPFTHTYKAAIFWLVCPYRVDIYMYAMGNPGFTSSTQAPFKQIKCLLQGELPVAGMYIETGIWNGLWHGTAQMLQVIKPLIFGCNYFILFTIHKYCTN